MSKLNLAALLFVCSSSVVAPAQDEQWNLQTILKLPPAALQGLDISADDMSAMKSAVDEFDLKGAERLSMTLEQSKRYEEDESFKKNWDKKRDNWMQKRDSEIRKIMLKTLNPDKLEAIEHSLFWRKMNHFGILAVLKNDPVKSRALVSEEQIRDLEKMHWLCAKNSMKNWRH